MTTITRPILGVYSLVDPRTGKVMYRGQANDIHQRYADHCDLAKPDSNIGKRRWIRGLIEVGELPTLVIEAVCKTVAECDQVERRLIREGKASGACEFNRASGGKTNRAVPKLGNTTMSAWYAAAEDVREADALLRRARERLANDNAGSEVFGHFLNAIQGLDRCRDKLGSIVERRFSGWDMAASLFVVPGDEYGR